MSESIVKKLLLPITLVAQLYMVTGRARPGAWRYVVESVAYYRGGFTYMLVISWAS